MMMASTSYPADDRDWRGLFIRRLVYSLAERPGVNLRLWSPPGEKPDGCEWAHVRDDAPWLARLMAEGGIAHQLRASPVRGALIAASLLRRLRRAYCTGPRPDLRHINWLQSALAVPADGIPQVVTVLGTDMQMLRIPGLTTALRRIFRAHPTTLCPNADWMRPALERRFGDVASIRAVPFGVDKVWFDVSRKVTSPPHDWICVSRLTSAKLGPLFAWGERFFSGPERILHLFGPMQETQAIPDWVRYHGPATPRQLVDDWFPRATGLITLSRHAEGRPQVMLEAMAAGVPILASNLPAHADFIAQGETGWLCGSPEEMRAGIDAIESPGAESLSTTAKAWVARNIGTWADCATRFQGIYSQTCARSRPI